MSLTSKVQIFKILFSYNILFLNHYKIKRTNTLILVGLLGLVHFFKSYMGTS